MTALEIILILIIRIGYGIYSFAMTKNYFESLMGGLNPNFDKYDAWFTLIFVYCLFSPIFFVSKAIYGIFKKYE